MENKQRKIGFEVKKISNLFKKRFNDIIQCDERFSNIPKQSVWIIGYLFNRKDQIICQKDLEKAFCTNRATMSKILTQLEDLGYIQRTPVEGDKRLNQICLTEMGIQKETCTRKKIDEFEEQVLSKFSDEEINQIFAVLDKLNFVLEEMK